MYDWPTIVRDCGPLVWQTAYRLLGNHADAADCFQETFLAALEVSRRQHVRSISGLLVRLATMRAVDGLRRKDRRERYLTGRRGRQDADDDTADPSGDAQTREVVGRLREAIAQLPPQEANVFCLRYLNDMSYRQIARELNMKINAVGVALHRARTRLREALGAVRTEEDEVPHETR